MKRHIVVLGATGNTGSKTAAHLLAKGHRVTAVARSADKLAALQAQGATPAVGDIKDADFLARTLSGADAVYTLIPPYLDAPDYFRHAEAVGTAVATAVERSGVRYAVNLSSQGADLPAGTGPVVSAYRQEGRLNLVPGLHVVHLRPAYFLENLFMFVPVVQHMGAVASAAPGDASLPMIATADIAAVAANYLDTLDFSGRNYHDLLGAANYSFADVAQALSSHLGREVPYVQLTREQQRAGMLQGGLSESMADAYLEFYEIGFGKGLFTATPKRTAHNTTPTTLQQFLPAVAGAIQAGVPA